MLFSRFSADFYQKEPKSGRFLSVFRQIFISIPADFHLLYICFPSAFRLHPICFPSAFSGSALFLQP